LHEDLALTVAHF